MIFEFITLFTILLLFSLVLLYFKGRSDEKANELLRSAEKLAEKALKVEQEARRTYEKVESVGPDTSVADGNKLLSGGGL